jgi:hypothetical protein
MEEQAIKPKMKPLTLERVREVLAYEPLTGDFRWTVSRRGISAGKAGGLRDGYVKLNLLGHQPGAHRVAWLLFHGVWPSGEIDHINGNRADNRMCNLRDVPRSVNLQNIRAHKGNKLGLLGVTRSPSGKYQARISIQDRNTYLGTFATPEEAHQAYLEAKREHHEGCTI